MALTDQERSIVRRAFAEGPSVLIEEGYTPETIRGFMGREDVAHEIQLLQVEFNHQEALFGRSVFLAKKNLSRLAPLAAGVLGRALAGPVYVRDQQGRIVTDQHGNPVLSDPGVTAIQLRAAENIIESMGVTPRNRPDKSADANLKHAFATPVDAKIEHTDKTLQSEEERTLSRERVRNVILKLTGRLGEVQKITDARFKKHVRGRSAAHPASIAKSTKPAPKGEE